MDKQQEVLDNLVKEAVVLSHGVLVVEFKVHQGRISGGEVKEQRKKLG